MRIIVIKASGVTIIDNAKINHLVAAPALSGGFSLTAVTNSGQEITLCERDTMPEALKEADDINKAANIHTAGSPEYEISAQVTYKLAKPEQGTPEKKGKAGADKSPTEA